jgi:hypothetical protein
MGSGFSSLQATSVVGDVANGITAAGTTNADATQINSVINRVTTAAASTGVVLMPPTPGAQAVVINSGANAVLVYPSTGSSINALTASYHGRVLRRGWWAGFVFD